MPKRGRPPHPGILTPREREVLELLRLDLTNEQIAQRLGISLDGAKYHVSEILSKLGVSSREEAAAWQPPVAKPLWRRAVALPLVAKATGLTFTAAAIAGLVILAIGVGRTNTSDDNTTATSDTPPFIGDHWHATLDIWICGEQQPDLPRWEASLETYNDGIIHIHPFDPSEVGPGAALGKFFDYGGGLLTADTMRLPGSETTYSNGDTCPDRSESTVKAWADDEPIDDYVGFIPQDGDGLIISFGPPDEVLLQEPRVLDCPPEIACPPLRLTRTGDFRDVQESIGLTALSIGVQRGAYTVAYSLDYTSLDYVSIEPITMTLSDDAGHTYEITSEGIFGSDLGVTAGALMASVSETGGILTLRLDGLHATSSSGEVHTIHGTWSAPFVHATGVLALDGGYSSIRIALKGVAVPDDQFTLAVIGSPGNNPFGLAVTRGSQHADLTGIVTDGQVRSLVAD